MPVTIELLKHHPELAGVLGRWHYAEFGHLYDDSVWSRKEAFAELEAMANTGSADLTWVAIDQSRDGVERLLGSVSLIGTDDLAGFDHLTPWLASLFVEPRARNLGVGSRLVDTAVREAAMLGHEYVYLFTAGQREYYAERGWREVGRVVVGGEDASVMTRATSERGARRAVSSMWCSDPDSGGAYPYLRVGGSPDHRRRLAEPILPGLLFGGEATSVEYPATMHGAWFAGERAADAVLAGHADGDVLVIGAGLAGIAAARRVRAAGRGVTVLEARLRPGGRVATDTSLGVAVPLGAAWLHGEIGHPLAHLVTSQPDDWGAGINFVVGHGVVDDDQQVQVAELRGEVFGAFATASPEATADQVLGDVLSSRPDADEVVRACVEAWVTTEIENLYGAVLGDFAPAVGFETYELPGDDRMITSDLGAAVVDLAADLDIEYGCRVTRLSATGVPSAAVWSTDSGRVAAAVIVTVPISVLAAGRIVFDPPLPADVLEAIGHLGTGSITKLFATYDTQWWPTAPRPIRIVGTDDLRQAVDYTDVTGTPTLCWFATGEQAQAIERMTEHEQCQLIDRVTRQSGLANWQQ